MKEGQRSKAPELFDLLLQQEQHPEQRPHSSVGHYDGQTRRHQNDSNRQLESDKTDLLLLREKEKVSPSILASKIHEEPSDLSIGSDEVSKDIKHVDDEVEIRSPSRKVSQDRPRLDKSQSTPTYEIVMGDVSSFEEKLRDIRLRKQSRVEEEMLSPVAEDLNPNPSPTPVFSKVSVLNRKIRKI